MPFDFQVVFPQTIVPLSSVRYLSALQPRTLEVVGEDFSAIDEVQVNGQRSPSVVVLSPGKMVVQVPDGVLDRVTSLTVISNRMMLSSKSLLRFRLGDSTTKASGMLRLMQLFVKLLFTTQGTDIWAKSSGGSALKSLGKSFSSQAGQSIIADFNIAVDQTARQIIATQAKDPSIPANERLMRAKVLSVRYNKNEGALIPSVELLNQAGQAAMASVSL